MIESSIEDEEENATSEPKGLPVFFVRITIFIKYLKNGGGASFLATLWLPEKITPLIKNVVLKRCSVHEAGLETPKPILAK